MEKSKEKVDNNDIEDVEFPKIPFNGKSKNLIERIVIVGYNQDYKKRIVTFFAHSNKSEILGRMNDNGTFYFPLDESPSIINDFAGSYKKEGLEYDILTNLIFPQKTTMYFTTQNKEQILIHNKSNIILSFSPEDFKGSKKNMIYFCKIFYEKYQERIESHEKPEIGNNFYLSFYFPKAICICSEYPYFSSFYSLSLKILSFFQKKILNFPLEVFIYNLIKFLPAPLSSPVCISEYDPTKIDVTSNLNNQINIPNPFKESNAAPLASNQNSQKFQDAKNEVSALNGRTSKRAMTLIDKPTSKTPEPITPYGPMNSAATDDIIKEKTKLIKNKIAIAKDKDSIYFSKLSCYPIIQYNLSFIFMEMSPELLFEVFLFTFLEVDLLVFSENLELLNMFLFSLAQLNFPFNDSIYYWHILSLSNKQFLYEVSPFAGKTGSTLLGVNDKYNPKGKYTNIRCQHLVLNLDIQDEKNENKFFFSCESTIGGEENIEGLRILFKRVIKNSSWSINENYMNVFRTLRKLYESILSLKKELYDKSAELNLYNKREIFFYNDVVEKQNRKIQKVFFDFCVKVLTFSYQDLSFDVNKRVPQKKERIKGANHSSSLNRSVSSSLKDKYVMTYTPNSKGGEVERGSLWFLKGKDFSKFFINQFYTTSKVNTYLVNFMLYFDTIDLYKIPLLIIDELVNFCRFKTEEEYQHKLDPFEIFDYIFKTMDYTDILNFFEIFRRKIGEENKVSFFTFANFKTLENLDFHKRLIRERKEIDRSFKIEILNVQRQKMEKFLYLYENVELYDEFFIKYVYQYKRLSPEDRKKLLPSLSDLDTDFQLIKHYFVSDLFEQYLFNKKIYKNEYYYIFSIFMLFGLTRKICKHNDFITELNFIYFYFKDYKIYSRKYLDIILNIYYKLFIRNPKDDTFSKCFNEIAKLIKRNGILPNEKMLKLINKTELIETEKFTPIEDLTFNENFFEVHPQMSKYRPEIEYEGITDKKDIKTLDSKLFKFALAYESAAEMKGRFVLDNPKNQNTLSDESLELKCRLLNSDIGNASVKVKAISLKKIFNDSKELLWKIVPYDENSIMNHYEKLVNLIWNIILYSKNLDALAFVVTEKVVERAESQKGKYYNRVALFFSDIFIKLYKKKNRII